MDIEDSKYTIFNGRWFENIIKWWSEKLWTGAPGQILRAKDETKRFMIHTVLG